MKELFDLVASKTTTVADLKEAQERIFPLIAANGPECAQIKKEFDAQYKERNTLLHAAARAGNAGILLPLMEFERELRQEIVKATRDYEYRNFSIGSLNNDYKTFLDLLIQHGEEDQVIKLIDELDELEKKQGWFSTDIKHDLFKGSIKKSMPRKSHKILMRLLNYQDLRKGRILYWNGEDLLGAIEADFHEGIKTLLQQDIYQNQSHRVRLFKSAVDRGSLESVRLLAEPPCDINAVDDYGRTALHYAAASAKIDMDIIRFLIASGAKIDIYDNLHKTPLQLILDKEDLRLQEDLERILSSLKSNQEQHITRIQSIKSIQKRLPEINYSNMDLRLFSHINLDAVFAGSPYEGMTMSSTSRYLLGQLKSHYFGLTLDKIFEIDHFRTRAEKIKNSIANFITDLESCHRISLFMDTALSQLILSETKYDRAENKKKGRDKLYDEVAEFILPKLNRSGVLNLLPGGYKSEKDGQSSGHAMMYGLKFEKISLIFTLYNTGDGIDQHEQQQEGDKLKYSPILEYQIPMETISDESLRKLLRELTRLRFEPLLECKDFNATKLYLLIDKKVKELKATLLPLKKSISFITGQRAGNCAWKIMQLLLKQRILDIDAEKAFLNPIDIVSTVFTTKFKKVTTKSSDTSYSSDSSDSSALKNTKNNTEIDQEIYKILKFELHLQSLLEFYVTMLKFGKFDTEKVQFPIKEAIYNLNRALHHKLPKEWKSAHANEAYFRDLAFTFQTIIGTCADLPPKTIPGKIYSVKEMLEFDNTFQKISGSQKDVTQSKAEKEMLWEHYIPGENLGDTRLLAKMQQVELQMNKMRERAPAITIKMFENLVNKVPIYSTNYINEAGKFWDSIKRDEAFQIMQVLCRMTRVYLCTTVRITPLLLPSNLVALYSVSFIQFKLQLILLGKGFRNHLYTVSNKCKDMLICHELSKLDVRYQELSEAESRVDSFSNLKDAKWLTIATRYYTETQLENIGYRFKEIDLKLKNRRIANIAEYGVLSGWFYRQELKSELLQDLDFYILSKLLHADIFGAVSGSSRQLFDEHYLPFLSDPSKFRETYPENYFGFGYYPDLNYANSTDSISVSMTEKDWRVRYESYGSRERTDGSKEGILSHKRDVLFSKNFSFTSDSSYLHAMKGERSIVKRFLFKKFSPSNEWDLDSFSYSSSSDSPLSSNKIQAHITGDLTRKASKHRQILHTRTERETAPSETLDIYLSDLAKLKNPVHRTLISCNFLNPGQMFSTLEFHPEFAEQLLDFIEQGLLHHIDGSYIDHAVPYLAKLNIILMDYLKQCELRVQKSSKLYSEHRAKIDINIQKLSKVLRNFISTSEALTSKKKQEEARLLCRKMHLNLVHLMAIEFYYFANQNPITLGNLKESGEATEASKDKIMELFKALLYLGTHPIDLLADGNDEDPMCLDFISEAMYYCAPYLKTELENLKEKEPEILFKAIKDVIQDIYPIIDKLELTSVQFPIVTLSTKTGSDELTINCLEGTVVNQDLKLKDLPLWVYKDSGYQSVFGSEPRQGFVSESEETVLFTVSEGDTLYRYQLEKSEEQDSYYGRKPDSKLFKEIEIEGEKRWYAFYQYGEQYFPKFLYDNTMVTWADLSTLKESQDKTIGLIFARKTGQNLYKYSSDSKIYVLTKDGKVSKQEILNTNNTAKHPNSLFEIFEAFDSLTFTKIVRDKESNEILVDFLRHGARFKSVQGGPFIWEQDSRYEIVLNQQAEFIPGLPVPLHLKPREEQTDLSELILVPKQVIIADPDYTGTRADSEYFYPVMLDIFGAKQQDIFYWICDIKDVNEEYHEAQHFAAKYWTLENSCQYATYALKGKLKIPTATTAEDALFLSYLQFGCKQYQSAFQNLEQTRTLGFEGSRRELEIIAQILLSVPYRFLSDVMKKLNAKSGSPFRASQVNNAFTATYKARILVLVFQHIAMGGKFCLTRATQKKDGQHFSETYEAGIDRILQEVFSEEILEAYLKQTLQQYYEFCSNIPQVYQLKSDELMLLHGRLSVPSEFEAAKYEYYLKFYRESIKQYSIEVHEAHKVDTETNLIPIPKLKAKALSMQKLLKEIGIISYESEDSTVILDEILFESSVEDDKFFRESQVLLNKDFKKGASQNHALKQRQTFYIKEFDTRKRELLQATLQEKLKECDRVAAESRQKLILLANTNSFKTEQEVQASFRHKAFGQIYLSFDDIIELYRARSYKLYAERTALLKSDIETLFTETFQYFLELNQSKQYQRTIDLLKEINTLETSKDASDLLLNTLSLLIDNALAELNYDLYYKDHQTIIFECEENILVRSAQKYHVHELTKKIHHQYQPYAFKMQMGQGKTKVVIPLAGFLCADGSHFIEIDAPSELLRLMARDHQYKAKKGFNQEVVLFEFHRGTDCRLPNLRNIRDKFLSLVHHRGCLDASPVTKQSLRLKWLDMLGSSARNEHYNEILILDDILGLSEERGVVLIDELDSDPKKELNFTSSSPESIESSEIDLAMKLYFEILEKLSIQGGSLKNFLEGEIPPLNAAELDALKQSMIKLLFELPDAITQLKLDDLSETERNSFSQYLFGNSLKIPAFILAKIEQIEKAKGSSDLKKLQDHLEIIAFYKAEIAEIFPITTAKLPNVNFGYSKDSGKSLVDKRIAIPYFGNNTPNERAKFASHLVTMGLTIQLNMLFGVLPEVMNCFLNDILEAANKERDKSFGLIRSIDDTPAAKEFYALTGLEASRFPLRSIASDTVEFLATAKKMEVVKYCLKKYVLPHLKIHRRILRQNAQDYTHLGAFIRGCSGTFESIYMLDERLRQNYKEDLYEGIDGQTLEFLLRKDKKASVFAASSSDAFTEIEAILKQNPSYRAIMDAAALFQGIPNITVAKFFAKFFKASNLQYILFFNEQDKLFALSIANPEASPKILRGSDWKILAEDLRCAPKDYFSYYDQLRCKGIDLRHMPYARALVTVGAKTKLNEVLQASKRMRDETHAVDFLISKQFMASNPEITDWTLRDVFKHSFKTQVNSVLLDNYRVALQKIYALLRSHLLILLRREKVKQKKFKIYDILAKNGYIYSEIPSSLFAHFGHCIKEEHTEILLNKALNVAFDHCNETLIQINQESDIDSAVIFSKQLELRNSLEVIVREAIKVCKATSTSSVNDYLDSEVEVIGITTSESTTTGQAQAEAQTLNMSQNESQTETLHAGSKGTPMKEEELDYFFSIYELNLVEWTKSKPLNSHIGHLCSGFKFSPQLYVSKSFWESCREQNLKRVDIYTKTPMYILFSQSKMSYGEQTSTLQAFFITEKEAVTMAKNMRRFERDKSRSKNHIWICTRKKLLFAGEPPEKSLYSLISRDTKMKMSKEVDEILEQSAFFGGDVYWLALKAKRGELSWLSKDKSDLDNKLKFFEKTILALHPESIEMYQRYKELFLSREKAVEKKAEKEEIAIERTQEPLEREKQVKVKKFI